MDVEATKPPATINIEAKTKELVENELDSSNFMYLGKSSAQRDVLFLFGMALGWRHKLYAELEKPCSGGFIRTTSFSSELSAIINLVQLNEAGFDNPNALLNHKESYKLAEKYANAGLRMIEGEIRNNEDSETFANRLIAEMDDMYDEWSSKYHYAVVKA